MNIIYGTSLTVRGNIAADIMSAAPTCKHFFRCLNTDGSLRDIGDTVVVPASGFNITTGSKASVIAAYQGLYDPVLIAISNNATPYPATVQPDPWPIQGAFHTFAAGASIGVVYAGRVTNPMMLRFVLGDLNNVYATGSHPGTGIGMAVGSGVTQDAHVVFGHGASPDATVAIVEAESSSTGAQVTINSGGSGYPGTVNAVFTAGTTPDPNGNIGTGAAGYFTVAGGVLTAYTPTSYGQNYYPWGGAYPSNGTVTTDVAGTVAASLTVATALLAWGGLLPAHQGLDVTVIASYTPNGRITLDVYDSLGNHIVSNVTGDYASRNILPAFQPDPYLKLAGLSLYAAAYFEFTSGIPSNFTSTAQAMGALWKAGNRVFPASVAAWI